LEGSDRQIERVGVVARWANVSNDDSNTLAGVGIGDLNIPTAVLRFLARLAVPGDVNGTNEVTVAVIVSAGTGITILVVISSLSTGVSPRAASVVVIGAAGIITAGVVVAGVVARAASIGGLRLRVFGIGVIGSSGRSVGVGGG